MRISDWSSDVCSSDLFWQVSAYIRLPLDKRISRMPAKEDANGRACHSNDREELGGHNPRRGDRNHWTGACHRRCLVGGLGWVALLCKDRTSTRLNSSH